MVSKLNAAMMLRDHTEASTLPLTAVVHICDFIEDQGWYQFDHNNEVMLEPVSENAALEGEDDPESVQEHYDAEPEEEDSVIAKRGRKPKPKAQAKPKHKHRK
jgi:hypothetical protein